MRTSRPSRRRPWLVFTAVTAAAALRAGLGCESASPPSDAGQDAARMADASADVLTATDSTAIDASTTADATSDTSDASVDARDAAVKDANTFCARTDGGMTFDQLYRVGQRYISLSSARCQVQSFWTTKTAAQGSDFLHCFAVMVQDLAGCPGVNWAGYVTPSGATCRGTLFDPSELVVSDGDFDYAMRMIDAALQLESSYSLTQRTEILDLLATLRARTVTVSSPALTQSTCDAGTTDAGPG